MVCVWSECESVSSTWKELTTVKHIILSMVNILKDKRIKLFTDNQNVDSIVDKGSMKLELQDIALCIFTNFVQHHISIDVKWVPRTTNDKADYIIRIIDSDDWGVAYEVFVFRVPVGTSRNRLVCK